MKHFVIATLVAALGGLGVAPTTAQARHHDDGDEALAAIGGFIGGVIVGAALDSHDRDYCPPPPRVVVETGYHARRGHWEWVSVRAWVPGCWVVVRDDHGRRVRTWNRGHYEHRRERVWVTARAGRY